MADMPAVKLEARPGHSRACSGVVGVVGAVWMMCVHVRLCIPVFHVIRVCIPVLHVSDE